MSDQPIAANIWPPEPVDPQGMDMRITDRDLANNTVTVSVTVREVIHACPPVGSGVMPCCDRSPNEVPVWHRITLDDDFVTCTENGSKESVS